MDPDPDYILDVPGVADDGLEAPDGEASSPGRMWIGVQFDCCGVYARIYRNRRGTAYEGHCPRCARGVRIRIGPGGTTHRMFRAT